MGKYKTKKSKPDARLWLVGAIIVMVIMLIGLMWIAALLHENEIPLLGNEGTTPGGADGTTAAPAETTVRPVQVLNADLGSGLLVSDLAGYAGIYMEDGSNEVVTDVMMIILENTSDQDLQLARICLKYPEFTAEFEATNIPAGAKAVLLEKNRRGITDGEFVSVEAQNVVFFPRPMSLHQDVLEITGMDGVLNVKNISDGDITSDIYIYYKNAAQDIYYGGITYRVKIAGGIPAGELRQISAGHFDAESCVILDAVWAEQ